MSMFDDDLIENVKKYPILYRHKGKDYKNMIRKGNCWIKIGEVLNKTPEECKSKWRNIRDNYMKNKKKKVTGTATSYSKYDDQRLNFLSETHEDDELSYVMDNSSQSTTTHDPIEITFEHVKEEYDSSEEVPLSDSSFMKAASSCSNAEQPAFAPAIVSTTYDTNQPVQQNFTVQEPTVTPPPKRAMKRKMDSIIDELKKDREERNLILQQLVTKATNPSGQSPVHNFFSSMADIVCNFPPDKIAEVRMRVCSMVSEVELSVLRDTNQSDPCF
ncbi:hypothetical protein PYW08_013910 [Mythimna loreyi]|uniref:Uncharacterized protein n=1 Tax=Mythimna loreyi TaxID=667449 RepID=A0ACC2RB04_9NEOP|nr:hypothetical protein PYW08_013910 [Mythimna loreyi]